MASRTALLRYLTGPGAVAAAGEDSFGGPADPMSLL